MKEIIRKIHLHNNRKNSQCMNVLKKLKKITELPENVEVDIVCGDGVCVIFDGERSEAPYNIPISIIMKEYESKKTKLTLRELKELKV